MLLFWFQSQLVHISLLEWHPRQICSNKFLSFDGQNHGSLRRGAFQTTQQFSSEGYRLAENWKQELAKTHLECFLSFVIPVITHRSGNHRMNTDPWNLELGIRIQ